ncbi:MAG: Ig-like domain-containing protein [Limisphaerales bacterium]
MKFIAQISVVFALLAMSPAVHGQTIIADNYNVAGSGTGFALNTGVNSGINPPASRLTGTAASNLRYITTTTKADAAFSIAGNKLRVTSAVNPGRFILSANGSTSFDFGPALGVNQATPQNPVVYDLTISMMNSSTGTQRFSFALATAEGDATTWDFGVQLYRNTSSDNFYTIQKRIDSASSGLASDINMFITNTAVGTFGSEVTFLMRVTDAGAELTTFQSRVQLSLDGGFTFFYDTATDPALPNGWRLDGSERHIIWDVAPSAGPVTYDNFSLGPVPVSAVLVSPNGNAQNLGANATLTATGTNSLSGDLSFTFFGREAPLPGPGEDFLIPVLPDTQNYAREESGVGQATMAMWLAQTDWIVQNRVSQNIPYVATLGDCVHNATAHWQWRNATNAMYRLEHPVNTLLMEGIPYGVTVGNHDQDTHGDPDSPTTYYNQYFGTNHFAGRSYYGGHFGSNNDNWYQFFSAGGMDFLVFSFEFGRYGSTILNWAQNVINQHPNRRIIVLTHHAGSDNHPSSLSNQGSAIYEALKVNTNFFLMLGGHVFNGSGHGEGHRTNTFNGNRVYTLISNYQNRNNGGNGLMRLMYFSPSNNVISIKTYSPFTGNYETDFNSEFTIPYNMQPNGPGSPGTPWVALGTNNAVPQGTQASYVWTGLQPNKTYEWYVKVTDQFGNSSNTTTRVFKTTNNSAPVVSNQGGNVIGDRPTQVVLSAFDINGDAVTFQTNSRPIRGVITDFDPVNGTVTYLPAHGYRGLDRFTFSASDGAANSGVANFDLNVVAPEDTNANGIPDEWEALYGISDPNDDADGDGQSNYAEYIANTNPTNAASVLKIIDASIQSTNSISLTWSSIGGTRYRVETAESITGPFNDVIRFVDAEMDSAPYGADSTQVFTETIDVSGAPTQRYYRIRVAP